ncbi:MAG: hypothetical protein JKY70_09360 [Mucilaginibacter sp.]|nr:hypothetical protein [Mucilaginibacter sp.]
MKIENTTYLITLLFIVSLLAYYILKVCKAGCDHQTKAKTLFFVMVRDYFPLLISILIYFFLLSKRDDVVNNVVDANYSKKAIGSKEDNAVVYNSYAFMAGSAFLIGVSVFQYLLGTIQLLGKQPGTKGWLNKIFSFLCIGVLLANAWFFFHIIDLLFNRYELSTGEVHLKHFEFISTLSVAAFFFIDFTLYYSFKSVPDQNSDIKDFLKSLRFSIWNVDIASLLAISFIFYLDSRFLHYSDNYINYVFITSGIALQAVLTQFIFSSYQAKKTIDKLFV